MLILDAGQECNSLTEDGIGFSATAQSRLSDLAGLGGGVATSAGTIMNSILGTG
ncbi:hypothetical protein [Nocardia sp. NPDC005998]|uniref:hypothetical protein n=1 Tax=Nocardia sp. NPDC005998 TaxID=3156894 RepID=UPI0033B6BA47